MGRRLPTRQQTGLRQDEHAAANSSEYDPLRMFKAKPIDKRAIPIRLCYAAMIVWNDHRVRRVGSARKAIIGASDGRALLIGAPMGDAYRWLRGGIPTFCCKVARIAEKVGQAIHSAVRGPG